MTQAPARRKHQQWQRNPLVRYARVLLRGVLTLIGVGTVLVSLVRLGVLATLVALWMAMTGWVVVKRAFVDEQPKEDQLTAAFEHAFLASFGMLLGVLSVGGVKGVARYFAGAAWCVAVAAVWFVAHQLTRDADRHVHWIPRVRRLLSRYRMLLLASAVVVGLCLVVVPLLSHSDGQQFTDGFRLESRIPVRDDAPPTGPTPDPHENDPLRSVDPHATAIPRPLRTRDPDPDPDSESKPGAGTPPPTTVEPPFVPGAPCIAGLGEGVDQVVQAAVARVFRRDGGRALGCVTGPLLPLPDAAWAGGSPGWYQEFEHGVVTVTAAGDAAALYRHERALLADDEGVLDVEWVGGMSTGRHRCRGGEDVHLLVDGERRAVGALVRATDSGPYTAVRWPLFASWREYLLQGVVLVPAAVEVDHGRMVLQSFRYDTTLATDALEAPVPGREPSVEELQAACVGTR